MFIASLQNISLGAAPGEPLHLNGPRAMQQQAARVAQLVEYERVQVQASRGVDDVEAGTLMSHLPQYADAFEVSLLRFPQGRPH
jgi:hypothetical protein